MNGLKICLSLAVVGLSPAVPNFFAAQSAATTGSIQGVIRDEAGALQPGMIVNATLISAAIAPGGTPSPPFRASVLSDASGVFLLDGLPSGRFQVCVSGRGTVIGSCPDVANPTLIDLAAGQSLTVPSLVVHPGYVLKVRINDPKGLLAANEGKNAGAIFVTGLAAAGLPFVPLDVTSTDSNGRTIQRLVPYGVPMTFIAHSKFFGLADEKGNSGDSNGGIQKAFSIPAGGEGPNFTITVTGLNQEKGSGKP